MKSPSPGLRAAVATAACAVFIFLFPAGVRAADWQTLAGSFPRVVSSLTPIGRVDGTNRLQLVIGLPLRNQPELNALLQQIYDPASPNYHHYLTAVEFAGKFGPSEADYLSVTNFASTNHLTVKATHPNRTLVDVEGSVADIERVFHVKMHRYNHPTQQRVFYAPDQEPSVDLNVSLLKVSGLSDYAKPYTKAIRIPMPKGGAGATTKGGSGPGGTFMGNDYRNAYAPGVTLTGAGQKVAILELDGYYASDIPAYEVQAGLPQVPLTNVLLGGFSGIPLTPGGQEEVALDIENVIAMAPGLDQILVYEGTNQDDVLNRIATDNAARQISCSWGWSVPNPDALEDGIYKQYALQGQTFYDASGDVGTTLSTNVVPPSDDPYIAQVGGTELTTTGPLGSWLSETTWSVPGGLGGSTGGFSTVYALPAWQQGINMTTNGGSTAFRNFPDMALTADNCFTIADQGQQVPEAGTSCAAPLWAAFTALINQQNALYGHAPVGFICPALYALAKGPLYDSYLHDITTGNNTNANYTNQFFACRGYDLCTGWGTPAGLNLINALAPPVNVPVLQVVTNTITGGNGSGVISSDECVDLTFTITNEGIIEATGVQGFLYSTTPGAIVGQSTVKYPDLPPGASASPTTFFTLSTEPAFICGTPINLVLVLKSDQAAQTNNIQLPSGVVGPPIVFGNTTPMVVPEGSFTGIYSPVTVTNVEAAAKITVSVWASTVYDEGLSLQLISPDGATVLLTQYPNGGIGANFGSGCAPTLETIFDDDASNSIATGTAPFIGSYQPLQPLTTLLPASGTNLNGVWQLNATELFSDIPATLECWSLHITPYVCQDGGGQCPGSALSLTMTASPNPVVVDGIEVYNLTVSNAGPSDASAVVISQSLPPGFDFVSISNYSAQVILNGTNLTLAIGALPVYGTATISVLTIPTSPGLFTSVATVGATGTGQNTASVSTLVVLPPADLSVSMTASPASLLQGGLVTFTIVVTNNGPNTATDVLLTNELPANANYVSSTTSQGSFLLPGVLASLGSLPVGANAVLTVAVSPTSTGNITDTALVALGPSSVETDPVSFNNTSSFTVTVGPAADLAVSAVVTPATVVEGNNYTYIATVFNNGPSSASAVVFNQTIPGGVGLNSAKFVSSSQPGITVTNGNIIWDIGTLTNGASVSITNVLTAPTILTGGQPIILSSTFSVFGQPGNANPNNSVFTVSNLVEVPTITIVAAGATLVSQSGSTPNGALNPGETVGLQFYLQNTGNVATTNLQATLLATNGVTLPSGNPQNYGALAPGGSPVGGAFTFVVNGTNGGTVVARLSLQDGSANLGTVPFTFNLPVVQTFRNTNAIYIPATNFDPYPQSGPGSPYPSTIQVSNVTGFVSKVTVTVSNLSHTFPHDIGLLLVGPATNTVLMDAVAQGFKNLANATLTFDSTATLPLPMYGSFSSGTYEPSDYDAADIFTNAVAPPGSTNALNPPYSANLASFNGLPANGLWSLYAHDDGIGDAGTNFDGWSVTITTISPVNPTNSLAASIVASSNEAVLNNSVSYALSVTNNGATAVNAFLTNVLPAGLSFASATGAPGNYTQSGQTIIYNLGILSPGAGVTITNVNQTVASGLQTNTISAGVPFAAFNVGNNSATTITAVNLPLAELAAAISATPNPVIVNSNLTYTLWVTNLGPSNALATAGSFPLAGLNLVSVVPSQGSYTVANGAVQCSLGTISNGNFATVTVIANPTNAGTLTTVWSVSTAGSDETNLTGNSASAVVTVTYAVPIIAADGANLLTPGNGAINANETVTVAFTLTNQGYGATTNLVATLQATGGITPITSSQTYGVLSAFGAATQPFSFTAQGAPGSTVTATLALQDGANSMPAVSYAFQLPVTTTFSNSAIISIPQGAPSVTEGPASPYPSQISVSGLANVLVSQATVTLNGFAHTFPHDVNVLLESPAGQELILMGHAGGGFNATNLTLTFSDTASQSLPAGQLVSGTYLPTDYAPVDLFPGLPAASGASVLALFNGINPNGDWSLYVYDDTLGNSGVITGGWSLGLTTVSTVNPAALLAAGMISSPNPVFSGNYLNYQITITNQGPDVASSVVMTDTLPANVTFSSAAVSQGSVTQMGGTVIYSLGSISNGATATATLRVIAGAAGAIVNTANVTTASADLYPGASVTANTTIVAASPSPELRATNLVSGLQLTLIGQEGQNYAIQTSSDLLSWTSVFTNTASLYNGQFIYTDIRSNAPLRFYRAKQISQ